MKPDKMYRNAKLLKLACKSPCQLCGIDDHTIVAAHSNQIRDGKGMGIKSSDAAIAYLCYHCHAKIDQGNKLTKQQKLYEWEEAHRRTMRWLFEEGYVDVR